MNTVRLNYLISVLRDSRAEFGDRDDAAIALAARDEQEAVEALVSVAIDASTDSELADTCGESLAEIWSRRGAIDTAAVQRLSGVARTVALRTLRALSPELAQELVRSGVDIPQ
jgi:hypothetical protein